MTVIPFKRVLYRSHYISQVRNSSFKRCFKSPSQFDQDYVNYIDLDLQIPAGGRRGWLIWTYTLGAWFLNALRCGTKPENLLVNINIKEKSN